jgi:hypothetical protein
MHSKHAEPVASVTTGPTQPPPATSEPPRVDSVETEEGWKKVERKRWKGKREKKVGTRSAGGVPTCAAIAQGGGVSVNVFIGAGAERGRRSSKGISDPLLLRWQDERKEWALLFVLRSVCFFCLRVEWGEGEPWGASKGGLDHEDWFRIS